MIEDEYASYLIRLWRSADSEAPPHTTWQYDIEHIQSGEHHSLVDQGELASFLRHPHVIERRSLDLSPDLFTQQGSFPKPTIHKSIRRTDMTARVLQINMKFDMTRIEYEETVAPVVESIAAVPGLRWKIWIMNEAEQETGGIYLFDDEASVNAYLNGPIVSAVVQHPKLSDFSVKRFEVMEGLTSITRGPLGEVTTS